MQEPNAFTIVSVEPGAYQENQIAWTTTNMASSASLTLQTVSGLEQYQLPQRVVIETLIPFNQDNADSSLPELVDNKTIETDGNAIDPASGEDASIKSFDEKLDAAELNKEEVISLCFITHFIFLKLNFNFVDITFHSNNFSNTQSRLASNMMEY